VRNVSRARTTNESVGLVMYKMLSSGVYPQFNDSMLRVVVRVARQVRPLFATARPPSSETCDLRCAKPKTGVETCRPGPLHDVAGTDHGYSALKLFQSLHRGRLVLVKDTL
jgi:hypothetical protein